MRMHVVGLAVLGLACPGAGHAAEEVERPELKQVSTVRIANYGIPSTVITERARVSSIVAELRQLRDRAWRRESPKLSCYATLSLLIDTKTLTIFRIAPERVVERAPGRRQSTYSLAVVQGDLPGIRRLLAEIPPAKDCQ